MPQTEVVFFMDKDGYVPALEWIQRLPKNAQEKLWGSVKRLSEKGHELRRPECDYLRGKIYELRARLRSTNYRLLYFFHQKRAIISHGLTKEGEVPAKEIDRAAANRMLYEQNPGRRTFNLN